MLLEFLKRLPLKLTSGALLVAGLAIGGTIAVLEALGLSQQIADMIGRPIMRSAVLWLFQTGPWAPALFWLVCAALLFWLVRTSLKTEREFLQQREQNIDMVRLIETAKKVVLLRMRVRSLSITAIQLREEADRIAQWARSEPAPPGTPMAASNNAFTKQLADTALARANAALLAQNLGEPNLDNILVGKDLAAPVTWENGGAFANPKIREGREYFHKFECMMTRIPQAVRQLDDQIAALDQEMGLQP